MSELTLTEFLLARIGEDEAVARRVAVETAYPPPKPIGGIPRLGIVGYSTARVLAECEAKRRIVEAHPSRFGGCETCHELDGPDAYAPCATLRALAAVYAQHPDYRSEWTPDA